MFSLPIFERTHRRAVPRTRSPRQEAALLRTAAGGFVFGSEIKALLEHPAISPELDEEASTTT
jgi:hypothetical protein